MNDKVKFEGEVFYVAEGKKENQIRLAIHKSEQGWYSDEECLFCSYDPAIIPYRVLERDNLTIYGTASGLFSYRAISGAIITLPYVWIDRIEMKE